MGAEIDRLEVQIESEAAKASHELDLLVEKLSLLAEGISAIKSNKGLDEFASKAQAVTKSMESIQSGAKDMAKSVDATARKIAKSLEQITEQYKDLGKDFQFFGGVEATKGKIDTLSNALETAKVKQQELEMSGQVGGRMYENAVRSVIKYENQIESLKKHLEEITKIDTDYEIKIHLNGAEEQSTLEDFKQQLAEYSAVIDAGGAETEGGPALPYAALEHSLEKLRGMYPEAKELIDAYESEIERVNELSGGMAQYGQINLDSHMPTEEMTNKIKELGAALSSLEIPEIREENLDKLRNSLEKTEEKLDKLRANLANGITMGRIADNPDSKIYRNIQEQITLTEKTVDALRAKISEVERTAGNADGFKALAKSMFNVDNAGKRIRQSFSKVISVIKKFGVAIKSVVSKLGKMIMSMLTLGHTAKKSSDKFGNGLKTILKYGFSIRSLYVLVNKLKSAIKDGMDNLVQYSEKTNQSVSVLNSSLNQFKNASAAAVAPILNAIAPALNAIIQLFIRAANAVNQFFAALTGNGTWIKAKYVYDDVADGISKASKAAKGALQPFDALNNLTTQDSGSGTNPGDMFETVPVEGKFKDLADWLKDMWSDADFYDLGRLLGEKLKKALESIPWSKIKKTLRKIAKSIATFLNGFLETPGLFKVIGKTVAEAINSAFEFLDEFAWDFHWKSLGQAIVDAVQGFVDNLDWDVISSAIMGFAYGLVELFNTIFGATETWGDVGMTIAKAINTVLQGLFLFVHNFDFAAFGTAIGTLLSNALTNIAYWKLGDILANGINGAFTALYNFCETFDWVKFATKLSDGVNDALGKLDWEEIKSAVHLLAEKLGEWLNTFIGGIDSEELGSTIGNLIQLALDFVYTLKDTFDWTKVKDTLFAVLKSAIEEIDMDELAELLLTLLAAKIVIKAVPAMFSLAGKSIAKAVEGALVTALPTVISWTPHIAVAFTIGIVFGKISDELDKHFGNEGNENDWGIGDYLDATVTVTVKQWFEGLRTNVEIWWSETWMSEALWNFGQWWDEKVAPWFTKEKWSELWENIKQSAVEKWTEIKKNIKDKFDEIKTDIANKLDGIKAKWEPSWDNFKSKATSVMDKIKSKVKSVMDWIEEKISKFNSKVNELKEKFSNIKMPSFGSGSSSKSSRTSRINAFANGGFPEDGLFFANHGELVGQFANGKTAVANNEQITDGIAMAVQNANTEQNALLREQNQILRAILAKDGNDLGNVFDAVREEYIQRANRSGYTKDPVFG